MTVETGRNFTFKDRETIDPNARATCIRIKISQDTVNVKQNPKLCLQCARPTSLLSKHFFSVFNLLQF